MARTACQPPLRSRLKALGGRERKDGAMAVPQLLSDIIRVLLLLAPAAALVALVLAGISLTREGGTTFIIGGLGPLLGWFTSFGVAAPLPAGGIGTSWLSSFQSDVSSFVTNFVVGRLVTTLAAYFVLRAILDTGSGGHPLPSILAAMFLLGTQTTYSGITWPGPSCRLQRDLRLWERSSILPRAGQRCVWSP